MENRFKIINPVVSKFILIEKQFYENTARLFKKFENIDKKFTEIFNSQPELKITYDPCNYVRGGKIVRASKDDYEANNKIINQFNRENQRSIENISNKSNCNNDNSRSKSNNNFRPSSYNNDIQNKSNDYNKNVKILDVNKYRISEFKNLDEFLQNKQNENKVNINDIISSDVNQVNQNKTNKSSYPELTVRLSSVENFEKIQNNFSMNNENDLLTAFADKSNVNSAVNDTKIKNNFENNIVDKSNNINKNLINLGEAKNQIQSGFYPNLDEVHKSIDFVNKYPNNFDVSNQKEIFSTSKPFINNSHEKAMHKTENLFNQNLRNTHNFEFNQNFIQNLNNNNQKVNQNTGFLSEIKPINTDKTPKMNYIEKNNSNNYDDLNITPIMNNSIVNQHKNPMTENNFNPNIYNENNFQFNNIPNLNQNNHIDLKYINNNNNNDYNNFMNLNNQFNNNDFTNLPNNINKNNSKNNSNNVPNDDLFKDFFY